MKTFGPRKTEMKMSIKKINELAAELDRARDRLTALNSTIQKDGTIEIAVGRMGYEDFVITKFVDPEPFLEEAKVEIEMLLSDLRNADIDI